MRTSLAVPLCCVGLSLIASRSQGADQSLTAIDNRIPINITAEERNQVLFEMRDFLHDLFNINHALARKDMEAVARAAEPLGRVLNRIPPTLQERLPEAFLEMGHGMHEVFNVMARDARAKGDVNHTLGQLAEALSYCAGCHDTYRFQLMARKPMRGKP